MSTLRDLKDALEEVVLDAKEDICNPVYPEFWIEYAGMWADDLKELAKQDERITVWYDESTRREYVTVANRFKDFDDMYEYFKSEVEVPFNYQDELKKLLDKGIDPEEARQIVQWEERVAQKGYGKSPELTPEELQEKDN